MRDICGKPGRMGVPRWDWNSRTGEKMVQASGGSERKIGEHDANLLNRAAELEMPKAGV